MLVIWVHVALLAVCLVVGAVSRSNRRRVEAAEEEARRRAQWAKADRAREARQAAKEKREVAQAAAERKKAEREALQAVKREIAAQRRAEREAAQAAAHAVKVARAAELAELAERRLQAEREAAALRRQAAQVEPTEAAQEPTGADREPAQASPVEGTEAAQEPTEAAGMSLDAFAELVTPRPFAGQTVAFTGRVYSRQGEHVRRADLVELVRSMGGRAFEKGMPPGTTLLVVGDKPGMKKMDRADEWIGQVRKITPAQFWNMIQTA